MCEFFNWEQMNCRKILNYHEENFTYSCTWSDCWVIRVLFTMKIFFLMSRHWSYPPSAEGRRIWWLYLKCNQWTTIIASNGESQGGITFMFYLGFETNPKSTAGECPDNFTHRETKNDDKEVKYAITFWPSSQASTARKQNVVPQCDKSINILADYFN